MNGVLNYLAGRPPWTLTFAWWVLLTGITAATFIRITEILRGEDLPPMPPLPAGPVTLDLGLLERTQ